MNANTLRVVLAIVVGAAGVAIGAGAVLLALRIWKAN